MKKVTKLPDGRVVVETVVEGDSLTQQQFAEAVDINNVMRKFEKTGELPLAARQGVYADVSNIGDYHESLQKVLDANAAFMQLPPEVRTRFENDPGQLIEFLSDSRNRDEAIKLGLVNEVAKKPAVSSNDDLTTKGEAGAVVT